MILAAVAAGALWSVIVVRATIGLWKRPTKALWRHCLDAAVLAVAFSGSANFLSDPIDRTTHAAGVGDLIGHVAMAYGAGFTLIYMRTLRSTRPPSSFKLLIVMAWATALACFEFAAWFFVLRRLAIEHHDSVLAGRITVVLAEAWMGSVCAYGALTLRRIARRLWAMGYPARIQAVGLALTFMCSAITAIMSLSQATLAAMGIRSSRWSESFDLAQLISALLFGSGVIIVALVPSVFDRYNVRRELATLEPLWQYIQHRCPQVVLPLDRPTPILRLVRARIEIADGLRSIMVPSDTPCDADSLVENFAWEASCPSSQMVSVAKILDNGSRGGGGVQYERLIAQAWIRRHGRSTEGILP